MPLDLTPPDERERLTSVPLLAAIPWPSLVAGALSGAQTIDAALLNEGQAKMLADAARLVLNRVRNAGSCKPPEKMKPAARQMACGHGADEKRKVTE